MKVLAIELSSAHGSVAVAEGGKLLGQWGFPCERGRGAGIFSALEKTREVWREPDTVAVGIGPGSYNGLRTACAIASSFHMAGGAALKVAPSPCLLPADVSHYFVCGDARGGRAYVAEVRNRRLVRDIDLTSYEEAAAIGTGAVPVFRVGALPGAADLPCSAPEAAVLALLAPDLPVAESGRIGPIYLKPPHITLPRVAST